MGFRTCLQLLHCSRLNTCVAHIHHQVESFLQMICPLHNHIQCLDAFGRHMALRCYFCLSAIEVEPY